MNLLGKSLLALLTITMMGCGADRNLETKLTNPGTGDNDWKPGSNEKPAYTGNIANFNGTWTGRGSVKYRSQEFSDLDFILVVSEIPNRLLLKLQVNSSGNDFFHMQMGSFDVSKNNLQDSTTKRVLGNIGSSAFSVQSSTNVAMKLEVSPGKQGQLSGFYTDTTGKIEFSGVLTNSQF